MLEPTLVGLRAHGPAVELAYSYHFVLNITGMVINESAWQALARQFLHTWTDWSGRITAIWPGMGPPAIIYTNWYIGLNGLRGPAEVHPITAKRVTLAVELMAGSSEAAASRQPQWPCTGAASTATLLCSSFWDSLN